MRFCAGLMGALPLLVDSVRLAVMRVSMAWLLLPGLLGPLAGAPAATTELELPKRASKVYILPIREGIEPSLVYLVRRGVKEAIENKADLLVLDMETNGGRLKTTREIVQILEQFPGDTLTYVNKNAFSAGAFIAVATKRIYMAPGSVIGAAAPILINPLGTGTEQMPDTVERKIVSAVKAQVRTSAQKNGYNVAVIEAMVDRTKALSLTNVTAEGTNVVVLNEEGNILTLTNTEAEREYGNPPKKLLSSGTASSLEALLQEIGYAGAVRHDIKATGMERLGTWLNSISFLLLIIGVVGLYIEFKTPGFGLPGIVGITAFALYFLGGYVSGLSGAEWIVVFILGLALVAVEMFIYPGTVFIGLAGACLMLIAIVMALVDVYPTPGPQNLPRLPSLDKFELPLTNLLLATIGGGIGIWIASLILPKTSFYRAMASSSVSGVKTEVAMEEKHKALLGQIGTAISSLRPGGKAQFGDEIIDVISQGEMIEKGTTVRIIGSSAGASVVEVA
jgi:membrane-bound serine protease (ClpP class)